LGEYTAAASQNAQAPRSLLVALMPRQAPGVTVFTRVDLLFCFLRDRRINGIGLRILPHISVFWSVLDNVLLALSVDGK